MLTDSVRTTSCAKAAVSSFSDNYCSIVCLSKEEKENKKQFYFDNANFPLNVCKEDEKQFMNATEG